METHQCILVTGKEKHLPSENHLLTPHATFKEKYRMTRSLPSTKTRTTRLLTGIAIVLLLSVAFTGPTQLAHAATQPHHPLTNCSAGNTYWSLFTASSWSYKDPKASSA